jgi:hypothetical protein
MQHRIGDEGFSQSHTLALDNRRNIWAHSNNKRHANVKHRSYPKEAQFQAKE